MHLGTTIRTRCLLAAAVLSAAAAHAQEPPASGFLCCNLRSDGSWISDSNYLEASKTTVPLGTPVKFVGLGRNRVQVEINGKRQAIGNDYSRNVPLAEFARRYIVAEDPKTKLAAASPKVRTAIESMRVTTGMTRDQVLMALAYPIASENPNLDAPVWKYWLWSFSPFDVHFDASGRVSKVDTDPETQVKVWLD
jgi:hypothetical protein